MDVSYLNMNVLVLLDDRWQFGPRFRAAFFKLRETQNSKERDLSAMKNQTDITANAI